MPDEQSQLFDDVVTSGQPPVADFLYTLPRTSLKVALAVYLLAGLFLSLLSHFNYLLVHTLIEFSGIVLLIAVFLIGWNTRHLVRNQFFMILAASFLATGLVDLMHTLTYQGMQVISGASADVPTQLWLIARSITVLSFFCAIFSLGRKELFSARTWLWGFLLCAVVLSSLIWPLGIFPECFDANQGLTPFKLVFEYLLICAFILAGVLLWRKGRYLNQQLLTCLILSLFLSSLSEFLFTLYSDVHDFSNFLGHYFKLGSVVMVYFALIEGTLRSPFSTLFRDTLQSYEELNCELQRRVSAEKQRELAHQEAAFLYRLARAMHRTLNLDDLAHLTLSAAIDADAGGFERATLFTINKRTGMLQGMLGVSRESAPPAEVPLDWEQLQLDKQSRETQRMAPYNLKVIKQRLPLDVDDNALAKAYLEKRVFLVSEPGKEPAGGKLLAEALGFGPYACAPLVGRNQVMGILVVDNFLSGETIVSSRKRFLELFASLAGSALDNAGLVKRLEMAHDNLQDIQEQLLQGEKMAVLGEMAAQVAHELRNPLVSIGGFARRLSKQDLRDTKANEYAAIISREVRRMEEMLTNILAFSKKQLVCLENCNVVDILQEVFDLESEHCQRQNIELITKLESSLPEIAGDYRQLRQVFLNLMVNARQVMSNGGVLTVSAMVGSLRGDKALVVELEDTGGGILPEVMRNIFNPFFSTFDKGTGLGLSISHRIISHHYGEIRVINGERGARFIVTLPVAQPDMLRAGQERGWRAD